VFDFITDASGKIACYCALCKRFVAYIEINVEDFGIRTKKIYPSPQDAQYHPVNLAMWV
jgi:hypothetical protein